MKKANITHKYKEQVLVWNCTYFVAVVDFNKSREAARTT
jgi:hypothetical protein